LDESKASRKTKELKELPDLIGPNPILVFVGFNASIHAATTGHYYSRPANRFWPLLRECGLIPPHFTHENDRDFPSLGLGLIDLVKRPSNAAHEVTKEEFREGAIRVRGILEAAGPKAVCCVGKGVFEFLCGHRGGDWGLQADRLGRSAVYMMPSTSGRANRLDGERRRVLGELKTLVDAFGRTM